jgi:hypothetical protein
MLFISTSITSASTEVYLQKDVKEIIKGDIFTVNLNISSDKTINAIDGTITYNKDNLEIKTLKTNDSLLSIWVKEPIFDNEKGELSFVGGTPKGFNGRGGKVLEITFFAKKDSVSLVDFQDIFSVFLNDGKGTKINSWLRPLSISIIDQKFDYFNKNYIYYVIIFLIVIIFIMIKFFFKKTKKNNKL